MNKKIFILLWFFIFYLAGHVFSLDVPKHPNSELVKKISRKVGHDKTITYIYNAPLSQQQILQFYREMLTSQRWDEKDFFGTGRLLDSQGTRRMHSFFKDGDVIVLCFIPSLEDGNVSYGVMIIKGGKKLSDYSFQGFDDEQDINFAPLYMGAKQFKIEKYSKKVVAGYIACADLEEVRDFYISNMPSFGWELLGEVPISINPYTGTIITPFPSTSPYNIYQWWFKKAQEKFGYSEKNLYNKWEEVKREIVGTKGPRTLFLLFEKKGKICLVNISPLAGTSMIRAFSFLGLQEREGVIITLLYDEKQ